MRMRGSKNLASKSPKSRFRPWSLSFVFHCTLPLFCGASFNFSQCFTRTTLVISLVQYEVDEKLYCSLINTKSADAGIATVLDEKQVPYFKTLVRHLSTFNRILQFTCCCRNMLGYNSWRAAMCLNYKRRWTRSLGVAVSSLLPAHAMLAASVSLRTLPMTPLPCSPLRCI